MVVRNVGPSCDMVKVEAKHSKWSANMVMGTDDTSSISCTRSTTTRSRYRPAEAHDYAYTSEDEAGNLPKMLRRPGKTLALCSRRRAIPYDSPEDRGQEREEGDDELAKVVPEQGDGERGEEVVGGVLGEAD